MTVPFNYHGNRINEEADSKTYLFAVCKSFHLKWNDGVRLLTYHMPSCVVLPIGPEDHGIVFVCVGGANKWGITGLES